MTIFWRRLHRAWRLLVTQAVLRRSFRRIGRRSILMSPRVLINPDRVVIGAHCMIEAGATLYAVVDYGGQALHPEICIGSRGYFNHGLNISAARRVVIGDDVLFAYNVSIFDFNHGYMDPDIPPIRQPLRVPSRGVEIGDRVWVGANVFIAGDVRIGNGAVIGANSVVLDDVPPHAVAVGNPAKVVRLMDGNGNWNKVT